MRTRNRRGDGENRRRWEEAVRRWEQGGQSVRAFCLAEGLRESAFYFWRRRLAQPRPGQDKAASVPQRKLSHVAATAHAPRRTSPPRRTATFLPVRIVEDARESHVGVEIVLGGGRCVRVPAGFDRQTLSDVLAVLEARSC
jgi:hypothetical protein